MAAGFGLQRSDRRSGKYFFLCEYMMNNASADVLMNLNQIVELPRPQLEVTKEDVIYIDMLYSELGIEVFNHLRSEITKKAGVALTYEMPVSSRDREISLSIQVTTTPASAGLINICK